MAKLLVFLLISQSALAVESWKVDGHEFISKAAVLRYLVSTGKRDQTIEHTRCEIMTNTYTLKACPKNRASRLGTAPYDPSIKPIDLNTAEKSY